MPGYCDKIKDPVKRRACNKAGYAKGGVANEMSRVKSYKKAKKSK